MTDLAAAESFTEDKEGFRSNTYQDSRGLWTFGIGRCLETSPLTGAEWKYLLDSGLIAVSITHLGAQHLTQQRLAAVDSDFRAKWGPFSGQPDAVQTILVEMAFQLGVGGVLSFTTFLSLVANRQYAAAAQDGRGTAWYHQTPSRAEILLSQLEKVT